MARKPNTASDGKPFDQETIEAVWKKAKEDPGYTTFKKDTCGARISKDEHGKTATFGWEIDHIKPVSKGGTDSLNNLQPLHWENNRAKGDKDPGDWKCKKTM